MIKQETKQDEPKKTTTNKHISRATNKTTTTQTDDQNQRN